MPELALSVRQPWADQIMAGVKTAEYRSQPTKVRGRVYIYAGSKVTRGLESEIGRLPRGVVIGTVDITDCTWDASNGCFAWHLAAPQRFPSPRKPARRPNPVWFRPW